MQWEDGLLAFNEARRTAAGISSGDGQHSMFKSMDASLIDLDDKGTQAMLKLIMGQLNFHEMLYAVCERKTGKKLPADNFACREVRIRMGVSESQPVLNNHPCAACACKVGLCADLRLRVCLMTVRCECRRSKNASLAKFVAIPCR